MVGKIIKGLSAITMICGLGASLGLLATTDLGLNALLMVTLGYMVFNWEKFFK